MEFIDHTGHIFSIKSYEKEPIGSEYDITPYVFWLNSEYTNQLSIDNYYILPIRILAPKNISDISIQIQGSDYFSLVSSKDIHNLVENMDNLNSYIEINEDDFDKELTKQDVICIEVEDYYMIPFYVIGTYDKEGTILSKIMIKMIFEDESELWTPITVGGEYFDEFENLIINGQNMGVRLPKEILGAIYQYSYKSEVPDETLYASKIKEYLMNFIGIKGQIGNFNSVINSLNWFGYGEKLEIQKLLQTDNEFQNQFFLDDFTISTDLLQSYKSFRSSTYISLRLWENSEYDDGRTYLQKYSKFDFWGEGKPELENLFSKIIVKHYDEGDMDFYRSYYDYCFDELGLKLAMLEYYFKKFFLPIHLHIHSTAIAHHVFANDIKMLNIATSHDQEDNVLMGDGCVKFDDKSKYYIFNQKFYTDTCFNNLSHDGSESYFQTIGEYLNEDVLYINQPCVEIPIHFLGEGYYNCNLLLLKDDKVVFETHFQFCQDEHIRYKSFIILPKYINKQDENYIIYWLDSNYKIALLVNDRWYYHKFNIVMPEMELKFGALTYRYDTYNINYTEDTIERSLHTQINKIEDKEVDFNTFMYVPSLVETNDINFYDKLNTIIDEVHGGDGVSSSSTKTGILTRRKLIEKTRKKSYLKDFSNNGIEFNDEKKYRLNDTIIPAFYFNDYTKDYFGNTIDDAYLIEKFSVDIYIGFFNRWGETAPFAKKTIHLVEDGEYNTELLCNNPWGLVKDIKFRIKDWDESFKTMGIIYGPNDEYTEYEQLLEIYKDEIEEYIKEYKEKYPNEPEPDPLEIELPFKINHCILNTKVENLVIRFVWNSKLFAEDEEKSSYNKNGYPIDGFFKDITLELAKKSECSMEDCFVVQHGLKCIFRPDDTNYPEVPFNYEKTVHEFFDKNEVIEEAQEIIETLINENIEKSKSNSIISQNPEVLNRIHIYNLYHTGYKGEINPYTKKDKYVEWDPKALIEDEDGNEIPNQKGIEKDLEYYNENDLTNSIFDQFPSSIVPLKYNKEKYGDYKNEMEYYLNNEDEYKKNIYKLYTKFFKEPSGEQLFKWPKKAYFDYDFYLMHDETNWYVVFISQLPISYAMEGELDAPKELSYIDIFGHEFLLKHYRSGDNFLINRMYFNDYNGYNIFNTKDIIVATINNVDFPVYLDEGSKWKIEPYSLGVDPDVCTSFSNSNTCIFSIGNKNQQYIKGYYDVSVRYSIDGDIQHQQFAKSRIKIT